MASFAHADVLARLLARLPEHPPLTALTSRDLDDPAIGVLDAWAGVRRRNSAASTAIGSGSGGAARSVFHSGRATRSSTVSNTWGCWSSPGIDCTCTPAVMVRRSGRPGWVATVNASGTVAARPGRSS